jgi:hypothetical protein
VSPLQIARIAAAFANGGKIPNVHFVNGDQQPSPPQPQFLPSRIRRCFGESNEARGYGRDGSESDDVTGADCGQDRTAEVKGRSPTLGLMGSRPLIQPPADASPLPCLLKTGSMEEP